LELVRVAADRLSVRWYLGYDLDEELPDHSSLTRIRQRYGLAVFRRFFETIVEQCRAAGLVWGKELYFDATQVKADASLDSIAPRFAVEAHLDALFTDDAPDEPGPVGGDRHPIGLPVPITEAERQQLSHANAQRHDWLARNVGARGLGASSSIDTDTIRRVEIRVEGSDAPLAAART